MTSHPKLGWRARVSNPELLFQETNALSMSYRGPQGRKIIPQNQGVTGSLIFSVLTRDKIAHY